MVDKYKKVVAAGIVTFNPNIQKLDRNMSAIIGDVGCLYVFDNNSSNIEEIRALVIHHNQAERTDRIKLTESQENIGVAGALNRLFSRAESDDYEWIVSLDQDSEMLTGTISLYSCYMPAYDSLTSLRKDRHVRSFVDGDGSVEEIVNCITSGNAVRIKAWRLTGGFNENLFIDMVDVDFCYRLRRAGYKIGRINTAGFVHEMGEEDGYVRLLGKEHFTGNYNAFRKYYIFRNLVYVIHKYRIWKGYYSYKRLLMLFVATLLFERDKASRIRSEVKGIADGILHFREIDEFDLRNMGGGG